ncbi:MAG: DUF126 domain-containing protein [Xanthomonadales bacterium]|nr:DUF126 domain-containing protein [Xanthomonadales bacterium]
MISARVLVPGTAEGEVLRLESDLSFWGAVDPESGRIIDARHPQHGASLAGRVVLMHRSLGSSSGSAVLLELCRRKCAPAAIVLGEPDQVLTLGALVAREMGYAGLPVVLLGADRFEALRGRVRVSATDAQPAIEVIGLSGH